MQRHLIAIALGAIVAGAATAGTARDAAAQPAPDPGAPQPAAPDAAAPDTGAQDPNAPPAANPAPSTTGPATPAPVADADGGDQVGDQAISVTLGAAIGGRVTPGGIRIAGQFLYQLSEEDWFDGGAAFTFGSGKAACFRDRNNKVICQHGVADGTGVELSASVRRMFMPRGSFHPFARVGVGLGLAHFGDDDVSGVTIPAHIGGGVRVAVSPSIAVVAEGDFVIGFGSFSRAMGSQPQLGLAIAAGAEFRLR